ncbi:MAG: hypothetical protein ABSG25_07565 [Bryobacteraceae bacterium]
MTTRIQGHLVLGATVLLLCAASGCRCGHVPNTNSDIERQLREELTTKHLAIWQCNGESWRIARPNGTQSTWKPAPWTTADGHTVGMGYTVGTTDNGRYVLYAQGRPQSADIPEILIIDENGRAIRSIQTPCFGVLAQNLRQLACGRRCDCDQGAALRCFSLIAHSAIAAPSEVQASRSSPDPLFDSFDWSPDASRLVYAKKNKVLIYTLSSDESTVVAVGRHVSWSPDGAWIAYVHDDEIKLISPIGGPSRTLLTHAKNPEAVKWSPDSAYVLTSYFSPESANRFWDVAVRIEVIRVSDGAEWSVLYPAATGTRLMEWIRWA